MKRVAQPVLFTEERQTLDHAASMLQLVEDLSPVTTRNYLRDLYQFIPWRSSTRQMPALQAP